VNDHDMTRDQAQHGEYERKLAELLDILERVDGQLTPRHVTQRFREILADSGTDGVCMPATARGELQQFGIVFDAHLHGACVLSGPPAPGVTDSMLHATLWEAAKARAAARRDVEEARRSAEEIQDAALEKAARIEIAAREKAERMLAEARHAAARVRVPTTAARLTITLLPDTSQSSMIGTWWS
jgi:hypothetical protein